MKKLCVLALSALLTVPSTYAFASDIKTIDATFNKAALEVNGTPVKGQTILYNGRTYVSLNAMSTALNQKVTYDAQTKTATINDLKDGEDLGDAPVVTDKDLAKRNEQIQVYFNEIEVVVNGDDVQSDNFLYQDRTYVPLNTITKMLQKNITWDEDTNTVVITDKDTTEPPMPEQENIPAPAETPTTDEQVNEDLTDADGGLPDLEDLTDEASVADACYNTMGDIIDANDNLVSALDEMADAKGKIEIAPEDIDAINEENVALNSFITEIQNYQKDTKDEISPELSQFLDAELNNVQLVIDFNEVVKNGDQKAIKAAFQKCVDYYNGTLLPLYSDIN